MHRDGNDLRRVHKRMAPVLDVNDSLFVKTGLTGLIMPGERRLGKYKVQAGENREIGQKLVLIRD